MMYDGVVSYDVLYILVYGVVYGMVYDDRKINYLIQWGVTWCKGMGDVC